MAVNAVIRSPARLQRFHDIAVENLQGESFTLGRYVGKVVVIINIATYSADSNKVLQQMNDLHTKFEDVVVLGFPCNQFNNSENGEGEEILNTMKYVRPGNGFYPCFQLMNKVEVNGSNSHPVFQLLRETLPLPSDDIHTFVDNPSRISWTPVCRSDIATNFEKFLIAPNGKPYRRYSSAIQVINLQNDIRLLLQKFMEWREHQ